ncbi:unnamed protein product, partial [Symbiodinium necroappetens]
VGMGAMAPLVLLVVLMAATAGILPRAVAIATDKGATAAMARGMGHQVSFHQAMVLVDTRAK